VLDTTYKVWLMDVGDGEEMAIARVAIVELAARRWQPRGLPLHFIHPYGCDLLAD